MTKIVVLAAEPSGDALGASILKALKQKQPDIDIRGLGGSMMAAEGLESWFDIKALSVMGLAEVIPNLRTLFKRLDETAKMIEDVRPDIVLTIDAPDFMFRVVKRVRDHLPNSKFIHCVAPSVWAWRPGRAKKVADLYDGLLCLLPFEPPYFEAEGLKTLFIGHPVTQSGVVEADGGVFRHHADIPEEAQTIGLFFGSRHGELKRTAPILAKAAYKMQQDTPALHFIVPTLPHLKDIVGTLTQGLNNAHITADTAMKWPAFAACDRAMAVSGTVGLELAVAGIPHIIAYKANPLTGAILKKSLKVPYVHLANIIANQPLVPECLQENCTPENLVQALGALDVQSQIDSFKAIRKQLSVENADALIADFVLN